MLKGDLMNQIETGFDWAMQHTQASDSDFLPDNSFDWNKIEIEK